MPRNPGDWTGSVHGDSHHQRGRQDPHAIRHVPTQRIRNLGSDGQQDIPAPQDFHPRGVHAPLDGDYTPKHSGPIGICGEPKHVQHVIG